tara:strand:+ start:1711 stop:2019 length:309 start_codon:yes stop_codon:yes gene_type:complete
MAVETLPFDYSPTLYLVKFNNLIYTNKDWSFKAIMTKEGKKDVNYTYSRMMNKFTTQVLDGKETKKKVFLPSKSILFITKLIIFAKKNGYKIMATLTGDYKD